MSGVAEISLVLLLLPGGAVRTCLHMLAAIATSLVGIWHA